MVLHLFVWTPEIGAEALIDYRGQERCPACGRRIQTVVPKGGDGSAVVFVRHKTPLQKYCGQSRMIFRESWQ